MSNSFSFSPWTTDDYAIPYIIDLTVPRAAASDSTSHAMISGGDRALVLSNDGRELVSAADAANQFIIFQFGDKKADPPLLLTTENPPRLAGSDSQPDIHAGLQLLTFRVSHEEKIDPETRATLRLNFGQMGSNRGDLLTWAVAAGLDLYEQSQQPSAKKALNADLNKAMGNKPIEIPGGVGVLSFEVVKHREPPWWRKVFSFGRSETAQRLVSVLGFPALTNEAVRVIDELLSRFDQSTKPEVLFKSRPMRLVFTQRGRSELTGGNERVMSGALNRGFCLLARACDFGVLTKHGAYYDSSIDMLLPDGVSQIDALTPGYRDPFATVTYAVFKIGLTEARINPAVSYT